MFEEIIKRAVVSAQTQAVYNEGDYYAPCFDDNKELTVLYCGKCGSAKEFYPYIPLNAHEGSEIAPEEERQYFTCNSAPVKVAVKCKCEENKESCK